MRFLIFQIVYMQGYLSETSNDTLLMSGDSSLMKDMSSEIYFTSDMDVFENHMIDTVDLKEMFGSNAEYSFEPVDTINENIIYSDLPFALTEMFSVVLFLVSYCYVLSRYFKVIATVLRFPFSGFTESNLLKSGDLNLSRLLSYCDVMLFILLSLIISGVNNVETSIFNDNIIVRNYTFIFPCLALGLVFLYRFIIFSLMRWYSEADDFFTLLRKKTRLTSSFFVITSGLIILLAVFGKNVLWWLEYVVYLLPAMGCLYYIIRVYMFFKAEKVSFLQYILYFCAVDLIPLSFLFSLIKRF